QIIDATLELLNTATCADQRRQMPTRGGTPRDKFSRVQVILFGVGAQPANGGFALMDLRREFCLSAEPVANVSHCIALAGELQCRATAILAAGEPRAAMNPDDQRQWFV